MQAGRPRAPTRRLKDTTRARFSPSPSRNAPSPPSATRCDCHLVASTLTFSPTAPGPPPRGGAMTARAAPRLQRRWLLSVRGGSLLLAAAAAVLVSVAPVHAMPANPLPWVETLYDGTNVTLRLLGNELGHATVLEANGQVVVPVDPPVGHGSSTGVDYRYALAAADAAASGRMISAAAAAGKVAPKGPRVGDVDPAAYPRVDPRTVRVQADADAPMDFDEGVPATGPVKNLMCVFKFKDHATRVLPTQAQIAALMNAEGAGADAPAGSGSVRDLYLQNSYGTFDLESVVTTWYTCSLTEQQAAGTESATGSDSRISECMKECLASADADLDFSQFDSNGDGVIDAVGFLHSGYGAEVGGQDCQTGAGKLQRIWSHQWSFFDTSTWNIVPYESTDGDNGVLVPHYHISPSLWGNCGDDIGHMGVIAHETGHFLGIPDLYSYADGSGISTWGLMADSWGTDGTQYFPPAFSAWSKLQLGWIADVVLIDDASDAGQHTLANIGKTSQLMKITYGFPSDTEYLLVANRRPYGIDNKAPGDGILVWHIDEAVACDAGRNSCPGFPSQSCWPYNGNHYQVAVVQADGKFELEKSSYIGGNAGDVFIGSEASISGSGALNTNSYAGPVKKTGITLSDFSNAGDSVTFIVTLDADISGDEVTAPNDCGSGEGKGDTCFDCQDQDCTSFESWIGDGYCDDGMWGAYFNCAEFNFDGGDCLTATTAATPASGTHTSTSTSTSSSSSTSAATTADVLLCEVYPSYLADGFCDGEGYDINLNTAACGWDGGDCCTCSCNCGDYCYNACGEKGYDCQDPNSQDASCTTVAPVACEGRWSDWGACDCDTTLATRVFSVVVEAQGVGRACTEDDDATETTDCVCSTTTGMAGTTRAGTCADWEADGECDNALGCNTQELGFDGGDCCASTCEDATYTCGAHSPYLCLDTAASENTADTDGACGVLPFSWAGDGICDAAFEVDGVVNHLNLARCGWDGGDCCASTCTGGACPAFTCLDPSATENADAAGSCTVLPQSWVGDGVCDGEVSHNGDNSTVHEFNTLACGWDGGDCCVSTCNDNAPGLCVNTAAARNCRDPNSAEAQEWASSCTPDGPYDWIADGYCDYYGDFNTAACGWDGGDCCISTCDDGAYACAEFGGGACKDPSATTDECTQPADWVTDGYCDYSFNTARCDWDGGDCCAASCVPRCAARCEDYECGTPGYDCQDPTFDTTTTTVSTTTTLVAPDCAAAVDAPGCFTLRAVSATAEECQAAAAVQPTEANVERGFFELALPLGGGAPDEYFHTDVAPVVNCSSAGLDVTVAVRQAYWAAFKKLYGTNLRSGEEIVAGQHVTFFGHDLVLTLLTAAAANGGDVATTTAPGEVGAGSAGPAPHACALLATVVAAAWAAGLPLGLAPVA